MTKKARVINYKQNEDQAREFAKSLEYCLDYLVTEIKQHNFKDTEYFIKLAISALKDECDAKKVN